MHAPVDHYGNHTIWSEASFNKKQLRAIVIFYLKIDCKFQTWIISTNKKLHLFHLTINFTNINPNESGGHKCVNICRMSKQQTIPGGSHPYLCNVSTTNHDIRAAPPISDQWEPSCHAGFWRSECCTCTLPWRRESERGIMKRLTLSSYDLSMLFMKKWSI